MKNFWGVVLLAAAVPILAAAQAQTNDAFVGTWKLDVAKSKFDPGPAPKSITVTIDQDRHTSVSEVHPDGETANWSFTPSEGTSVPITAMQDSSVVEKRIDDRTVEHDWKMGNATMHGKAVLAKNGKHMTYTLTGTSADGKPIHNVEIYDKQ